jgi:metal-sulfur cluster biosynthetic enzyme
MTMPNGEGAEAMTCAQSSVKEQVMAVLHEIVDPCSLATSHPLSIVDLGLIRKVDVDGGEVRVVMGTTGPGCLYYPDLASSIHRTIESLPGVSQADVELDTTFVWGPEAMAPDARQRRLEGLLDDGTGPVRPQQWRHDAARRRALQVRAE